MKNNKIKSKTKNKDNKETLAYKIASGLKDMEHLDIFIKLCESYPRNILIKFFYEVQEFPDERIKKSKGALFTYLVQRYGIKKSKCKTKIK